MEELGGLARLMPWTAVCFLMGSLAISAIPPLNGFVSEWFTYQGLVGGAMDGDILMRIVFAFAVICLAITGALAVTCFVKAFGVTFLAKPRSAAAEDAKEVPAPMVSSMVLLTVVCVLLGLGAAWFAPLMSSVASTMLASPEVFVTEGTVLVSTDTLSVVSPLVLFVLMAIIIATCALVRNVANRKAGMKNDPKPWACGYDPDLTMETLASTVGANVRNFMDPLYAIRQGVNRAGQWIACFVSKVLAGGKEQSIAAETIDSPPVSRYDADRSAGIAPAREQAPALSYSMLDIVRSIGTWFGKMESGDFRTYIVYIVGALIFFLALIILVR